VASSRRAVWGSYTNWRPGFASLSERLFRRAIPSRGKILWPLCRGKKTKKKKKKENCASVRAAILPTDVGPLIRPPTRATHERLVPRLPFFRGAKGFVAAATRGPDLGPNFFEAHGPSRGCRFLHEVYFQEEDVRADPRHPSGEGCPGKRISPGQRFIVCPLPASIWDKEQDSGGMALAAEKMRAAGSSHGERRHQPIFGHCGKAPHGGGVGASGWGPHAWGGRASSKWSQMKIH